MVCLDSLDRLHQLERGLEPLGDDERVIGLTLSGDAESQDRLNQTENAGSVTPRSSASICSRSFCSPSSGKAVRKNASVSGSHSASLATGSEWIALRFSRFFSRFSVGTIISLAIARQLA